MGTTRRFPARLVAAIDRGKILGIKAGSRPHRIIGVWVVVLGGRVFVRSWSVADDGWYRAWCADPHGSIAVPGRARTVPVRAMRVRSERTARAISRAYAEKYNTPGSRRYVRDFARKKCREATLELLPR